MTVASIHDLPLDEIDVSQSRARPLDRGHAEALADSVRMQELLYPVLVRQVGVGYQLVDGRHRIEAFKILGRETIPAILSEADSDDEALRDEVMANLARRIVALDFCQHLFELKKVWLRLYPETANGGNKNVLKGRDTARSRKPASGSQEAEITAFDGAMAAKFDLGKTQIKEAVAIWKGLSVPSRVRLHGTPLAEKKTELRALSKARHARQEQILDLIRSPDHPDIQNVAEALFHLENGVTPNALERRFLSATKVISGLDDRTFDDVIAAHEERVIASLKRRGRI